MYTILPHIADVRMHVSAATQEDLFRSALLGMSEIQRKEVCAGQSADLILTEKVEVQSSDITTLLIDFLSEVLTLGHIRKAVFCKVEFISLTETELSAIIQGKSVEDYDEDIKAVTYHEADIIINSDQQLETIILFDI